MTVVVPTLGRPLLRDCLESILLGDRWPRELLVVDQGQRQEVEAYVDVLRHRGLSARHVPMVGRGVAAAMNRGFDEVHTRLVVVTHDDCRVATGWVRRLWERQQELHGPAVITGRVTPEDGREVPSVITSTVPVTYRHPLNDRDVLFPANMLIPLQVWEAVGPMDEDPLFSRAGEDNEWAYRALRAGFPIDYAPGAVVVHVAWREGPALDRVAWTYARAQGAFYGKYLRRADLHLARRAGVDFARGVWWWMRGRVSGDGALAERGRATSRGLMGGVIAGVVRGGPLMRPAGSRRGRRTGDAGADGSSEIPRG